MPQNNDNPDSYKALYPDTTVPDADKAAKFLCDFASGGPVTVVMIPAEGDGGRGQTFDTSKPAAVVAMRSFIRSYEKFPFQVFWLPNQAAPDCGHEIPNHNDIKEVRGVVLDFDPDKLQPLEEERLRLREVLDNMLGTEICTPYAAVDSGGGMQMVFRLTKPVHIPLDAYDEWVAKYEALVKALARSFGADTKTWRVNNLFRVPYTNNWPNASKKAAGRERTVSGVWHQGGPSTSLDDLRRLCVIRPEDLSKPVNDDIADFDGLVEAELVHVLGKPKNLPDHITTLLRSTPALQTVLKRPVDPTDMSRWDHSLCMSMARLRIPPGDMALILSAYGAKVQRTFKEKRLFSYVAQTVSEALAKMAVELGFESPADAEEDLKKHRDRMRLLTVREMIEGIFDEGETDTVAGLIGNQSTTVIYGQSGSGKTFVTLDLAYRVSLGLPWCGRRTMKGVVIYVAAESPRSVRRRLKALHDMHGHSDDFLSLPEVVNMYDQSIDFAHLRIVLDAIGQPIRMIIFDTLARSMLGGNENSTEHMSTLVANGDRLRDRYRTNIVWVHHSGKDESLGARGSSALRAATDTEIEVKTSSRFNVTKLRDADIFQVDFELRSVDIGAKKDGTTVTTCVVDWKGEAAPASNDPSAKLRDQIRATLEVLGVPSTCREIMQNGKALGLIKHSLSIEALRNAITRAIARDSHFKEFPAENEKSEKRYGLLSW